MDFNKLRSDKTNEYITLRGQAIQHLYKMREGMAKYPDKAEFAREALETQLLLDNLNNQFDDTMKLITQMELNHNDA